ncbi:CsbD family protein [Aurantimonas sp. Leaf443]|uniref:CsbD family protein n=1 Tax=Aurantimonas sp. Leaf443 TaxID=1736378 RepID=UPI0006F5EB63|nr:CsbD family protein [Aurantimonas sp. Leaf443]KQT87966.1 general stress protein CsbD [Aurantimonas sp. Leaf443]
MVDKHEVTGGAKELGGKLKEAAGKLVGNDRLAAEGRADQVEGKIEKNAGKMKDAVRDTLN